MRSCWPPLARRGPGIGAGAGLRGRVALLCLGARVPDLRLSGLELQSDYAVLARQNAAANGIEAQIHQGDLAQMPAALRAQGFDQVIANPPYFLGGSVAPEAGRGTARHETTPLEDWIRAGLRRLRPGGWLTLIQRADRLAAILAALAPAPGRSRFCQSRRGRGRRRGG